MAIRIVPDSAKMTVDTKDVAPDAGIMNDGQQALLHLTRNSRTLLAGSTDDKAASAIHIEAEVSVRLEPRDDITRWRFGFIQLARTTIDLIGYAGFDSADGTVAQNLVAPPIMPAQYAGEAGDYCLDSLRSHLPFTNARPPKVVRDGKGGAKIVVDTDDHPWQKIPLQIKNNTTGRFNFLYRVSRHFEAITVFVARNETGVVEPLLHAGWGAIWSAGFRWVGRDGGIQCVPSMKAKAFFVSDVSKGAPAGLESKITHPATEEKDTCNFLAARAVHFSRDSRNPSTVYSESPTWGSSVPREFSPMSQ